jgi:O-antigen/teichoic acid export membrane protein
MMIVFSYETVALWTGNPAVAVESRLILSLLAAGTACNGLVVMAYVLQLAHGRTRPFAIANTIAAIVLVPLALLMAGWFGAPGVAAVWLLLNAGYVVVLLQVVQRDLLRGGQLRWYTRDVGPVVVAVAGVVLAARFLVNDTLSGVALAVVLAGVALVAVVAAGCASPVTRGFVVAAVARGRDASRDAPDA